MTSENPYKLFPAMIFDLTNSVLVITRFLQAKR